MTEQQMRRAMREDDIDEDKIEAQVDRWADEQNRDRQEREYMENENDDLEYFAAQVAGGLAVIGAVSILLFIVSAIVYWGGI